mgnify:FL=1
MKSKELLQELISASLGEIPVDVFIKNGKVLNAFTKTLEKADIGVHKGFIVSYDSDVKIGEKTKVIDAAGLTLAPSFIDGHIHYEVTKLSITMFAKMLVKYGTGAIVTGLDETYTVLGKRGILETIKETESIPFVIIYGVPSKLPYTFPPSTLAYDLGFKEASRLIGEDFAWGVWETVKEFITKKDEDVISTIEKASKLHKPIFGCAPLANVKEINAISTAGVRLDHESYSPSEMYEKARRGMYVMIRESSVTHFLKTNIDVIKKYKISPDRVGFCTDDVYAKDVVVKGHLDNVVRMAISEGLSPEDAYLMASYNVAKMYLVDDWIGSISPGKVANIIFLDDFEKVKIKGVMGKGMIAYWDGNYTFDFKPPKRASFMLNTFKNAKKVNEENIKVKAEGKKAKVLAIEVRDENPFRRFGKEFVVDVVNGEVLPDVSKDMLYAVVVERHKGTGNVAVGFVNGFGLKEGAIASSSAPDDNNIVAVGTNKGDLTLAINHIIENNGGIVVANKGKILKFVSLPIGGILSDAEPEAMAKDENELDAITKSLGSKLTSAVSTMSFLPITAIPDYALTDKGLVDCVNLKIISPILEVYK